MRVLHDEDQQQAERVRRHRAQRAAPLGLAVEAHRAVGAQRVADEERQERRRVHGEQRQQVGVERPRGDEGEAEVDVEQPAHDGQQAEEAGEHAQRQRGGAQQQAGRRLRADHRPARAGEPPAEPEEAEADEAVAQRPQHHAVVHALREEPRRLAVLRGDEPALRQVGHRQVRRRGDGGAGDEQQPEGRAAGARRGRRRHVVDQRPEGAHVGEQETRERDDAEQRGDEAQQRGELLPPPRLRLRRLRAVEAEHALEERDLVGDRLAAVRLQRVQQRLVVHDAQAARGGVAVPPVERHFGDRRDRRAVGPLRRVDAAQRLGRAPHVAVAVLVAEGAFVVQRVADADVAAHVLEVLVGEAQQVPRHERRVQQAVAALAPRALAEVAGGEQHGVAAGGVAGGADARGVDVVEHAGLGDVVDDAEQAVALLGRGARAERGAAVALRVRVDRERDDAAAGEFDGDVLQRLLAALEAGHDDDERRLVRLGRRARPEQVGGEPLAALHGQAQAGDLHGAAVGLHQRRHPGADEDEQQAEAEAAVPSGHRGRGGRRGGGGEEREVGRGGHAGRARRRGRGSLPVGRACSPCRT